MEDLTDFDQRVESSYFTGLKGLSAKDRQAWETQYQEEIQGYPEEVKESFFKNKIFTSYFQNSTNPQEKELWENRMNLTREQKDIAVARRMIEKGGIETPTLEAEADSSLLQVAKKL